MKTSGVGTTERRRMPGTSADAGFLLLEVVIAMVVFMIVSSALAQVLVSAIHTRSTSNQKTNAEQIANQQLEWIRTLDYLVVGTEAGQPRGDIDSHGNQSGANGPTVPAGYSVQITVAWVADPGHTSLNQETNYRNVVVTVTRSGSAKLLTKESTQVGPRTRPAGGGAELGDVQATVADYYAGGSGPMAGVDVTLSSGPSSPLDDVTDANGLITFPGLEPNPASGAAAFYDLDVPAFGGYVLAADTVATHFNLAPGQSVPSKTLLVFKPSTLTIPLFNADGTAFAGTVPVKVTNSRGSKTFTYAGTPLTVSTITNTATGSDEPLVPESYTITVPSWAYSAPVIVAVPQNYPTVLTANSPVTAPPTGTFTVTVTQAGLPVAGATVTVTGGPKAVSLTGTTNASGVVSFPGLPVGSGYTVTVTRAGQSASSLASLTLNTTTAVPLPLPVGTVVATVTKGGVALAGATLTLSGGPVPLPASGVGAIQGTSDAAGKVTFTTVPAGTGYTVVATNGGGSVSVAAIAVTANTTTNVPLAWPLGTVVATVNWLGTPVTGATVTLSCAALGVSVQGTTLAAGTVTFANVPAGTCYTVTATKNGQQPSTPPSVTVTTGSTPVTIAMPTATIVLSAATLTWAAKPVPLAAVTVSGGPNGGGTLPASPTTDASGNVSITVPSTSVALPYTMTVTKNGYVSPATTINSLPEGTTVTPTVTYPSTQTGTIALTGATLTWVGKLVASAAVTITGGPNPVTGGYTGTTDATGAVSVLLPVTTASFPYTVTATKNAGSGAVAVSAVATGAATGATVAVTPTKTIALTITRNGSTLKSTAVAVSITGGPDGAVGVLPAWGASGLVTSSTGTLTAITVPSGTATYTVKVNLNSCTLFTTLKSGSAVSVSGASGATSVTIDLASGTCPFSPLP